jgi:hypothetical protein
VPWRARRSGGFDRLQRGSGLDQLGVARVDGVRELVDGALDPHEQSLIDGEFAGGEVGETGAVEGDVPLSPDEVTVGVGQGCVRGVEESVVEVAAERLDAAPGGRLDPVVEPGARAAVGRGRGRWGHVGTLRAGGRVAGGYASRATRTSA